MGKNKEATKTYGKNAVERNVNIVSEFVSTQSKRGGLGDGSPIIGLLDAFIGSPGDFLPVCDNTSNHGGTVVSAETNDHDAELRYFPVSLECEFRGHGLNGDVVVHRCGLDRLVVVV